MRGYGKLSSEFYALDKPSAPPDAFDFYERHAREAGGHIHEPMCGSGRFLLPLLAQGLDVSGSDTSPEMLAACRERGRQLGLTLRLEQRALQELTCPEPPRLIFIPSGSFGLLLDDPAVRQALQRVHDVLAPGGMFLVEAERLLPVSADSSWLSQYSGAANITHSLHRYELVKDGQLLATELEDFRVRSYASDEFRALLEQAGFGDIQALKPYDDAPADESDDAIVFRCRKAVGQQA
jgi:SAM-dependent methyltransferase